MPSGSLVVVGSGPGVGTTTAALFASKGFNAIALLSRSAERIQADAKAIQQANPNATIKTYAVDAADHVVLRDKLQQAATELGPPEVVLFNVARIAEATIGEEPPESLTKDFQTMNVGLYTTATWALPHLVQAAKKAERGWQPCFFLSGGYVFDSALPAVFSLSMNKAAQHNLMRSLWKSYGPQGVHVALVNIGGVIADENKEINRKNIADKFWILYEQKRGGGWQHQIDVPDETEKFDLSERQ